MFGTILVFANQCANVFLLECRPIDIFKHKIMKIDFSRAVSVGQSDNRFASINQVVIGTPPPIDVIQVDHYTGLLKQVSWNGTNLEILNQFPDVLINITPQEIDALKIMLVSSRLP